MSTESVVIRKGTRKDLPAVLALVKELALFEKAPDEVTNTLREMEEDGFGPKPAFEFLVADLDGEIAGIALYFVKYSTWKGKGIYLDDLIVTSRHRGKGIGKKLFQRVIDEAKKRNAKQLHWQVLDWNTPAIDFYRKYGVVPDGEWLDCKLNEDQITQFAK